MGNVCRAIYKNAFFVYIIRIVEKYAVAKTGEAAPRTPEGRRGTAQSRFANFARLTDMKRALFGGLAVLGALVLCLCACASGTRAGASSDASEPSSSGDAPPAAAPHSEPLPASAPAALPFSPDGEAPPGQEADPAANPLTGLEKPEGFLDGMRPLAVMIDNVQAALPQSGLQSADLVYEMVTEGGITRLMAVYSDPAAMPRTGPVRSARDQHVQMMFPLGALYLHVGGSAYAREMLERYHYEDKSLDGYYQAGVLELDSARSQTTAVEHCWYTDSARVAQAAEQYGLDTALPADVGAAFRFVPYAEEKRRLAGGGAREIYLRFSSYANSTFSYDGETGQYVKSQFGAPQLDENTGEAVTFDNLLLLFTEMEKYPDGVLTKANLAWGGVGYYACGGRLEAVRWAKGAPEQPLRILSPDGMEAPVALNPGRTYVAMAGLDLYPYFRVDGRTPDWKEAAGR